MKPPPLVARTRRPAEFPGEIAGASLKPPLDRPAARVDLPFPGEIAGASLKRVPRIGLATLVRTIPRRNRRGLIEAVQPCRGQVPVLGEFPGEIAGASLKPARPPSMEG